MNDKAVATTQVALTGGTGYALADLVAGALFDFAHITITASREAALAVVFSAIIHHFFAKPNGAV